MKKYCRKTHKMKRKHEGEIIEGKKMEGKKR